MAYPVMIGSISLTVLNITDTIFLGRIGETELGASALGGVFYFVMVMIGVAIGVGTQVLIARRAGEKKQCRHRRNLRHSVIILFALSLLQFFILVFMSDMIFGVLIDAPDVKLACIEFFEYRSIGFSPS
jgi:Na+-driven multidrug efflux pump